jgi:plasmid maintenance system killer protein
MILSFKCKDTLSLFEGKTVKRFRAYVRIAERKLAQIHAAQTLDFLRSPPSNQLGALRGDRKGSIQHPNQRSVANLLRLGKSGTGTYRDRGLSLKE